MCTRWKGFGCRVTSVWHCWRQSATTQQSGVNSLSTYSGHRLSCYQIQYILLHWLPVRRRVEFKLACLVCQALCGQMPTYLADDIHLVSTVSEGNRRSLRSSSDNMCAVPRTHNSFGDRSFGAAGPRIWNSLPCGLRTLDISYKHFKTLLKTYV